MTFGQAIETCFRKYVDFTGFAPRSEYWWWTLFTVLVSIACRIVDAVGNLGFVAGLWYVAVLLPTLAVGVRRLRDAGYAWGYLFLALIPLVGGIILIVLLCKPSQRQVALPQAAPAQTA
jgi:uncharacterized membrane protein YhaH (DUF805 family)